VHLNSLITFQEQRELWLAAINRFKPDGSLWMPNTFSTICSRHFESGRPCPTRSQRDYVPSIFAPGHRSSRMLKLLLKRALQRSEEVKRSKPVIVNRVSTQTDFLNESKSFKLECCRGQKRNEKSTFILSRGRPISSAHHSFSKMFKCAVNPFY